LGDVMAHLCADTPGPASRRSCRPGCLETLCLARRGCPANTLDAAALGRRGRGFEQNGAPPACQDAACGGGDQTPSCIEGLGARRCTISANLVITVARSRPYLTAAATCRITHMDPFGFFVMLTMATFTLLSGGVLTSLVVLERKPHRSQGHTQPIKRRRA